MEYQTTLNQFDNNLNYQPLNSYQQPTYQQPSYYQTTLNQFDTGYNINSGPGMYPSNRMYGQFSTGGNLHDTFQVDRYNNLYNTHTTVDLGNGVQKHIGW